MAARTGKLAHLPNDIREQLNLRLLEGETGRDLAAWLNALPEVQSILGSQFNGSPISEVNLTHWRQGGYLQWLTERECFDSARALADGDCDLASTGLSAERLLNVLTVRYGQLLMRWDFSPDETVSESAAFSEVAKKARILQGISRTLLAIHRIQSQPALKKSEPATSPASSRAQPEENPQPSPAAAGCVTIAKEKCESQRKSKSASEEGNPRNGTILSPKGQSVEANGEVLAESMETAEPSGRGALRPAQGLEQPTRNPHPAISQIPFKPDLDPSEILQAV